ncbi:ABC-three component system protein [Pseudomonas cerasi]
MEGKVPLSAPSMNGESAVFVTYGIPVPKIDRLKLFSAGEWEEFTLEWAHSMRDEDTEVERCGGAGDMGRDVIVTDKRYPDIWDNYQCKHYEKGLTPTDIWLELGKLVYYTFSKAYTLPRAYFFIAPKGVGTKLSNLLKKPEKLKAQLKLQWKEQCEKKITKSKIVELHGELEKYLDGLDFSIFKSIQPLTIIEQHSRTRWHAARFGGGLPARPDFDAPPEVIASEEVNYVRALLEVYGEVLNRSVSGASDLASNQKYHRHLSNSRTAFYSAEALRTFSRDTLPPGPFKKLQLLVKAGVTDTLDGDHKLMFDRVIAVTGYAELLPITDNPLIERLTILDKKGICHQLVNDGDFSWRMDDE